MSLSCNCNDEMEWWYEHVSDYMQLDTKRGRKCCSCGEKIKVGEIAIKFHCYKSPENDIERRIHGDEVPLSNKYHCEECADIYFNLDELGYCINLGESMHDLLQEYQVMQQDIS